MNIKSSFKYYLSLYFLCTMFSRGVAQDIDTAGITNSAFTNFWTHPAYTGREERFNINAASTFYYLGVQGKKQSELFFATDVALGKKKDFGLGALFATAHTYTSDILLSTITFSKGFGLTDKTKLHVGISVSPYYSRKTSFGDLSVFPDQIHPVGGVIYPTSEFLVGSKESTLQIFGTLKGGAWIQNSKFFSGLTVSNIYPVIHFVNRRNEIFDTTFDVSGLSILNTTGYYFVCNQFQIVPIINAAYMKGSRFDMSLNMSGIYRRKYLLNVGTDMRISIYTISAGAMLGNKLCAMLSTGIYSNSYLQKITGLAFVNIKIQYHFNK